MKSEIRIPADEFEMELFRSAVQERLDRNADAKIELGEYIGEGRWRLVATADTPRPESEGWFDGPMLTGWVALAYFPGNYQRVGLRWQFTDGWREDMRPFDAEQEREGLDPAFVPGLYFANLALKDQKLYSGPEIAAELGIDESQVRRLARQHDLGAMVGGGRVYTQADLEALRNRRGPGQPRKDVRA